MFFSCISAACLLVNGNYLSVSGAGVVLIDLRVAVARLPLLDTITFGLVYIVLVAIYIAVSYNSLYQ